MAKTVQVSKIGVNFVEGGQGVLEFKTPEELSVKGVAEYAAEYVNKCKPGMTVLLPLLIGTADGKFEISIPVTAKTFKAAGVKYTTKKEEVKMENVKVNAKVNVNENVKEEVEMNAEKETIFDLLDAMVEEGTKAVHRFAPEKLIAIMNGKDSEVYDNLYDALISVSMKLRKSGKKVEGDQVEAVADKMDETVEAAVEGEATEEKKSALREKIGAFIAFVFRKTVALLKGAGLFVFDTTTILGAMVGRIAYHTGRELVYATKTIAKAFKTDIWDTVKNA